MGSYSHIKLLLLQGLDKQRLVKIGVSYLRVGMLKILFIFRVDSLMKPNVISTFLFGVPQIRDV